jgi:hypothetical protein
MKMMRFFKHFFVVGLFSLFFVTSAGAQEVKIFTSWKFNVLVKHDLTTDKVKVTSLYYNYMSSSVGDQRLILEWPERYYKIKEMFSDPENIGFAKIAIGNNVMCSLRNDGLFRFIHAPTWNHVMTTSPHADVSDFKVKTFKVLPDITPNVPWIVPSVIILQLDDNTFFPLFLATRSSDRYLPRPPQFGYRKFFTEEDFADERTAKLLEIAE